MKNEVDPILACFMYDCYRVINNDLQESEPSRDIIKAHLSIIAPSCITANEALAKWHYGYVQFACNSAAKELSNFAKLRKSYPGSIKGFLQEANFLNFAIKEQEQEPQEKVSLIKLFELADVVNKDWLKRLFFVNTPKQITDVYKLKRDDTSLYTAAFFMLIAKRNGIWPVMDNTIPVQKWAEMVLHRAM